MLDEKMKESVKEIFDNYDENQNGVLDRKEFVKGFKKLLKSLSGGESDQEIEKIASEAISKFDLNKNGVIELEEFNDLMAFLIIDKGLQLDDL